MQSERRALRVNLTYYMQQIRVGLLVFLRRMHTLEFYGYQRKKIASHRMASSSYKQEQKL